MKISRFVALFGLLLYFGSFLFPAVERSGGGRFFGLECAVLTLISTTGSEGRNMLHYEPLNYFATLLSGWINPVFLVTTATMWADPHGRASIILRILLLLMLPACWIVFRKEVLQPLFGYWLWTASMLVVVFSTILTRQERAVKTAVVAG